MLQQQVPNRSSCQSSASIMITIITKKRFQQNASPQAIVNGTSVKIKARPVSSSASPASRQQTHEKKTNMISHLSGVKESSVRCTEQSRTRGTFNRLIGGPRGPPMISIVLSALVLSSGFCYCDNNVRMTSKLREYQPKVAVPLSNDNKQLAAAAATTTRQPIQQTRSTSSHKDNLLASLSESIERQHFMKPIRSLVQLSSRPSKFDEHLDDEPTNYGGDSTSQLAATMTKSLAKTANNSNQNEKSPSQKEPPSGRKTVPGKQKVNNENKMRAIMMMHEHGSGGGGGGGGSASQYESSSHSSIRLEPTRGRSSAKKPVNKDEEPQKSSNRWFDSILQPSRENNDQVVLIRQLNSLIKPIKAVSYLSPLVSGVGGGANGHRSLFDSLIGGAQSGKASRLPLNIKNTFIARANNQMSLRYGAKKVVSINTAGADSPPKPQAQSSSTDMPQSTVLSRPYDTAADWQSSTPMTALNEPLNDPLMAESSSSVSVNSASGETTPSASKKNGPESQPKASNPLMLGGGIGSSSSSNSSPLRKWIKTGANQMAQGYFQDSFRDLLTLSQLPILSGGPVSTAPSELEPGGKKWLANKVSAQQASGNGSQTIDDILRYLYIFGTGVRRKRDPLKILGPSKTLNLVAHRPRPRPIVGGGGGSGGFFSQRSNQQKLTSTTLRPKMIGYLQDGGNNRKQLIYLRDRLNSLLPSNRNAKPRGVMWDMATDPSLAVTVFHLLERASVALPLGFLLMPFVRMIRNPMNGFNMGRLLPPRAAHRSVDYEELAKRLDMIDKIMSRALRQTHREASFSVMR